MAPASGAMSEAACGHGRAGVLRSAVSFAGSFSGVAGVGFSEFSRDSIGVERFAGGVSFERSDRKSAVTAKKRTIRKGVAFCMARGCLNQIPFGNVEKPESRAKVPISKRFLNLCEIRIAILGPACCFSGRPKGHLCARGGIGRRARFRF